MSESTESIQGPKSGTIVGQKRKVSSELSDNKHTQQEHQRIENMIATRYEIEHAKNVNWQAISCKLLILKNKREYLNADNLTKESMMKTKKTRILKL